MWLYPGSAFDFTATELRAMRADLAAVKPLTRIAAHGLIAGLLAQAHIRDVWGWALFAHAMTKG